MTADIITYTPEISVLVSVRGHPFERDAFSDMFDGMEGIATTFVDQPAAAQLMTEEGLAPYDVLCLYDMPGLDFLHADAPGYIEPNDALKGGLAAALEKGVGVVALHHAIAGWPTWDQYGDWIGGRFLYRAGTVRGVSCPDSGYRHDVTHTVSQVSDIPDALKPLLGGIPPQFTLKDELYLAQVFEADVVPLLRSDYRFKDQNFYSATRAVAGDMFSRDGWSHEEGSNLIQWAKAALNSPLVYLQSGDTPETYKNETYRKLVENALRWAASDAAHTWARTQALHPPNGASQEAPLRRDDP